jgi:trigger factor
MQVTETLNQGLKRELKLVIGAADLSRDYDVRVKEVAKTITLKGFRAGKVPVPHVTKMYGKSIMGEVVQKKVDDSTRTALADRNLKPAYQPEVKLPEDTAEIERVMDGKGDLSFTIAFEIVPEITVKDFAALTIPRHVVEVSEAYIAEALDRIANQYKDFEARAEGAKAEKGDRVTISFVGSIDGVPFDGGSAESVPLELGSNQFIPGFEDQLTGTTAGQELTVNVTFPETYGVAELAGKPAAFATKVEAVEAPKVSAIDEDFAKKLGLESLEKLREVVKERIADEFKGMSGAKMKRDVLDMLDKEYSFDLPEKLVEAEFSNIWRQLTADMERTKRTFADENTTEDKARVEYRAIAERRVRLGLLLGTVGEQNKVTISDEEMQRALMERARQFPGQEREVFEFYRKNRNALMELRGPLFEQKVIDLIASQAKIEEKSVSREELQKLVEDLGDSDEVSHAGHDHSHAHDHDDPNHVHDEHCGHNH